MGGTRERRERGRGNADTEIIETFATSNRSLDRSGDEKFSSPCAKHAVKACANICFALASLPLSGDHHFNLTRTLLLSTFGLASQTNLAYPLLARKKRSCISTFRSRHVSLVVSTYRTARYDKPVVDVINRGVRPVFHQSKKSLVARRQVGDLAINHNWLYTHLEACSCDPTDLSVAPQTWFFEHQMFFFLLYVTMSPSTVVFYKMRLPALYCSSQRIGSQCCTLRTTPGILEFSEIPDGESGRAAVDTVQHHVRGLDAHRPLASSPPSTSHLVLFARPSLCAPSDVRALQGGRPIGSPLV